MLIIGILTALINIYEYKLMCAYILQTRLIQMCLPSGHTRISVCYVRKLSGNREKKRENFACIVCICGIYIIEIKAHQNGITLLQNMFFQPCGVWGCLSFIAAILLLFFFLSLHSIGRLCWFPEKIIFTFSTCVIILLLSSCRLNVIPSKWWNLGARHNIYVMRNTTNMQKDAEISFFVSPQALYVRHNLNT